MGTVVGPPALCHPKRRSVRDGRCRECCQVGRAEEPDDLLPALIANTVQHAGPALPIQCLKCRSAWAWDATGDFARCQTCGQTFYRTSTRVLSQPKNRDAFQRAAQALSGRPDRVR